MNDFDVMQLIAEGETTSRVDYKRELHLQSAEGKSEFIKDVISLANSAPGNKGYLIIGVDDDKYVVGSNELEEERIQQIVHSYIRPSIIVRCHMIPMHMPNCPSVGVIEIQGMERPHRVVRGISGLRQDQVFVRHGSVIAEANPEEIRRMQQDTESRRMGMKLVEAAETHLSLGNFTEAIEIYTRAIEEMPTDERFLDRGRAHRRLIESRTNPQDMKEIASQALKDLSDAIHLTSCDALEKESRLERLRIFSLSFVEYDAWQDDVDWLMRKTKGQQKGEVIYLDWKAGEDRVCIASDSPREMISAMDRALQLGYDQAGVYELRARANYYLHNYGLALEDVDSAIEGVRRTRRLVHLLCFRATVHAKAGLLKLAYEDLSRACQMSRQDFSRSWNWWGESLLRPSNLVWRGCIDHEFGQQSRMSFLRPIFQLLIAQEARQEFNFVEFCDGKRVGTSTYSGKAWIEHRYSEIVDVIKDIVGSEFWSECEEIGRHGTLFWDIDPNS
jgi:tetratricopeptide (TPR) repeat protein